MELDELHVLEDGAGVVRRSDPVAGAAVRVRRVGVDPARRAGGQDNGTGGDLRELSLHSVEGDDTVDPAFAGDHVRQVPLLVEGELLTAEPFPEALQQREAGAVRGVDGPGEATSAERSPCERAVGSTAEDRPEMFHLDDGRARLPAEELDRVLVPEVVGALHRVVDVGVDRILRPDRSVDPSLSRPRVRAQGMELRNDGDVPAGLDRREGSPLPGEARADHDDIVT